MEMLILKPSHFISMYNQLQKMEFFMQNYCVQSIQQQYTLLEDKFM